MAEALKQSPVESPEYRELLELGRIAGELCYQIEQLIRDVTLSGNRTSRESALQREVFVERREEVARLLGFGACGSIETRICRLERLVEALKCSLAFFLRTETDRALREARN